MDRERIAKIAKAVKASMIGQDPNEILEFMVKEVDAGNGPNLGKYVCTTQGFHCFQARMGKRFYHVYCERDLT